MYYPLGGVKGEEGSEREWFWALHCLLGVGANRGRGSVLGSLLRTACSIERGEEESDAGLSRQGKMMAGKQEY